MSVRFKNINEIKKIEKTTSPTLGYYAPNYESVTVKERSSNL